MIPTRAIASAVVLANAAASYGAIVTPISSTRTISVLNRETSPQTSMSASGPMFGAWQASVHAINDSGQPNYNPFGSVVDVTSSQQSDFGASGVSFAGFVFIDYSTGLSPILGTSATNRCDAVFHVDGPCPYAFQATFSGTDLLNETTGTIFLRNNATLQNVFSVSASSSNSGTLAAGDYTFSILLQANNSGSPAADGRKQAAASLVVPAPAALAILAPCGLLGGIRSRRSSGVGRP
jgi:hypothetical protein